MTEMMKMDEDRINTTSGGKGYKKSSLRFKSENENIVFETTRDVGVVRSFYEMGLKEELLQGIFAYSKFCLLLDK